MAFVKFVATDQRPLPVDWSITANHLRDVSSGKMLSLSMGLSEAGADAFFIACFVKPSGVFVSARALADLEEFELFEPHHADDLISRVVGGRSVSAIGRSAIVEDATLMLAARAFFERGERDATLHWRPSVELLQRLARGERVG